MKTLYCAVCSCKVAEVEAGSKLKKGMTVLCSKCETKRKAADMVMRNKGKSDPVSDFLGKFGM